MPNLNITIKARQSGKTTIIIQKWMKDYKNNILSFIICKSHREIRHIVDVYVNMYGHEKIDINIFKYFIVPVPKIINSPSFFVKYNKFLVLDSRIKNAGRFLIDEYLFFTEREKEEIYKLYIRFGIELGIPFEIYTTSDRIYNKKQIEFVKQVIILSKITGNMCIDFKKIKEFISEDFFGKMSYNLICQPEASINIPYENMKHALSEEQFKTCIGEFIS